MENKQGENIVYCTEKPLRQFLSQLKTTFVLAASALLSH